MCDNSLPSTTNTHIGYLVCAKVVLCRACGDAGYQTHTSSHTVTWARLWKDNILPYRQKCHRCDKVMVGGQSWSWRELFPPTKESHTILQSLTLESKVRCACPWCPEYATSTHTCLSGEPTCERHGF